MMPAAKPTEAVTAALCSCRYRAFRDQDCNLTLTYWQLLTIRLGFIIMFEVPAAEPCRVAQGTVLGGCVCEDLPPQLTCVFPLTSSTWFSLSAV